MIPTKEVKMLIPSTAASLHRAFRKPKAVVLLGRPQSQVTRRSGPRRRKTGRASGERWQAVFGRGEEGWPGAGPRGNTDQSGGERERRQEREVSGQKYQE